MQTQIQTLKGFRDFLPAEKRKRQYVAGVMSSVFERYGFAPLETPTLEYAELLLGKYGEEADTLVYTFTDRGDRAVGLRYDQTVPTARVLTQYQNELPKYFRRYQIQNVFRADKPQKGRFREFTQCDCDIFGSISPVADAELLAVLYAVYKEIGFGQISLLINDRQLLANLLSEFATPEVPFASIVQTIDKLDKVGADGVTAELVKKGHAYQAAAKILSVLENATKSKQLLEIEQYATALGVPQEALLFTPTLARGLDYYTGMIIEVQLPEYGAGSVAGGGRYDNLISELGGPAIPAVGFGIGFDRTLEAADSLGLLPTTLDRTRVLVTLFDESSTPAVLSVAKTLRAAGVATEVYPAIEKLGKQFKLADQKQIPFAVVVGPEEVAGNTVQLKNMATGEQQQMQLEQVVQTVQIATE